MQTDPRQQGEHALKQANLAAKRGDLAAAERWTKVATQAVTQLERVRAAPPARRPEDEPEAVRAELRRRLRRYTDFCQQVRAWEAERDAYIEALKLAAETGAPPPAPLRMHPAGPSANAEPHLIGLIKDPEPDDGR